MSHCKSVGAVLALATLAGLGGECWGQCEEIQKLLAPEGAQNDHFGTSIATSDYWAMAGAYLHDTGGSVYVYSRRGSECDYRAMLTASDAAVGDFFGTDIGISGQVAIVGADGDDDNGTDSGSAYVFRYVDGTWVEEQKLTAGDGEAGDSFGLRVAIDGDVAIVGASYDDDLGTDSGSAYMFRYVDGIWTEEQKLTAPDGSRGDWFGLRLAISGEVAMVGAISDDNENGLEAGSVYVFRYQNGEWNQEQKLLASDGSGNDLFGTVAISGDVAVVTAFLDDGNGTDSGSAYVFRYVDGSWDEEQKLTASNGGAGDFFGGGVRPIALNDDMVVIAAPWHSGIAAECGSAYVFRFDGTAWYEDGELLASDAAGEDHLGMSVGISGDSVIVGASHDDDNGTDSGSAYVFDLFSCLCLSDLDENGSVDFGDILEILTAWGPCEGDCPEDLDEGGTVDFGDVLVVLSSWGRCEGGTCGGALCGDACRTAQPVGEGSFQFSTDGATEEGPDLPETCDEGNGLLFRNDIWFKHTAPCDGTVTASVCDSDFDTRLAVYEYSEDECPGTFIACSDDACGENGTRSEVSFPVESGGTYLIRIGARFAIGEGTLVIDCQE